MRRRRSEAEVREAVGVLRLALRLTPHDESMLYAPMLYALESSALHALLWTLGESDEFEQMLEAGRLLVGGKVEEANGW